ncbi:MAG TPA: TIGR03435 family protein [Acidobacteriaceae bacterium]|nr:TIGR03435 family protein [Acidobacteriaceae bacterium]
MRKAGRNSCITAATFVLAALIPASAQLAHLGPSGMIKLSQTLPPYDVSTVKVNDSGEGNSSMSISDSSDTMSAKNIPIEMMIEYAYDVKADRISGLGGPVKDAHFDVNAKVLSREDGNPPKLADQQLQAMMIPLLGDRFHLKVHLEQKIMPAYELVVAHGGPKLKLSTEATKNGSINMNGTNADRILTASSASMADVAEMLSDLVHREVIDKTGLDGRASMTLKWTADEAADQGGNVLSIFTALEEQLGLKLVSSKGPVECLVVDHIEMPTPN